MQVNQYSVFLDIAISIYTVTAVMIIHEIT
jgi:hypothetical protein